MVQKFTLFAVLLFIAAKTYCQEPKGTGKTTTIKVNSEFNSKVDKVLPTGHWTFTNASEILCKEGDYAITGENSVKTGTWTFYNTEGLAMLKINYAKDVASSVEVIDSGSNDCGSSKINITIDTGNVYHISCFEFRDIKEFTVKKVPAKITYSELMNGLKSGSKTPMGAYGLVVYPWMEAPAPAVFLHDTVIMAQYPEIKKSLIKNLDAKSPANLVLNPGFDKEYKYKKIADDPSLGKHIFPYWFCAFESPDPWHKGKESFAGFRVIGSNYEIIGGQLKKPLNAGTDYCFQMKIRLKSLNHNAVYSAGMLLSPEPLNIKKFKREDFEENVPVLLSSDSMPIALRNTWQTISGKFTAQGGENYLYLGVFPPGMKPRIIQLDSASPMEDIKIFGEVYYYIDDIVLLEKDTSVKCPCNLQVCPVDDTAQAEEKTEEIKPKMFVFQNIQFETNKATLLETAFPSLDSVLTLLDDNPKMKLMITGHTDNEGDSTDNQTLSEERAKTVYDYLIDNRIAASRLAYQGKGESEPVASNKTAKGRARNRRVTFTIME